MLPATKTRSLATIAGKYPDAEIGWSGSLMPSTVTPGPGTTAIMDVCVFVLAVKQRSMMIEVLGGMNWPNSAKRAR